MFDKDNNKIVHSDYNNSINNREKIILTSIITGYRKIQRVNQEPFNAFYNSYYQDCINADKIITIGYSFSDPHLNLGLKNALENKNSLPFDNITYSDNPEAIKDLARSLFGSYYSSKIESTSRGLWYKSLIGDHIVNLNFKINKFAIRHYLGGFESFLKNKEWD